MKYYGITLRPVSPFGTPLKGDTIFGHFCWQVAENDTLLEGGLDAWITRYQESPFAVFSSACPVLRIRNRTMYAVPRPCGIAPADPAGQSRKQRIESHKADKKRKWLLLGEDLKITLDDSHLKTDSELFDLFLADRNVEETKPLRLLGRDQRKLCIQVRQAHNSINRLTMTTGRGEFAPFSHDNFQYLPGLSLVVFVGLNEQALGPDQLRESFVNIGNWGFGRDASAGLGRFTVDDVREVSWPRAEESDTACYALGPLVPEKATYRRCYAVPFTRYGRHGAGLARSANPFKSPVVMADEGAVLFPDDRKTFASPYIGTAVTGVSAVDKRTVVQGYSLYLPC